MDDYDPQRDQRPRRPENEADDAWAAAEEDDLAEPDVEIEDLAAGYEWNDPAFPATEPPVQRRTDSRPLIVADPVERPPTPLSGGSYDPARGYPSGGPLSTEPFNPYQPPARPHTPEADHHPPLAPGCLHSFPLWAIVLVVVLGMIALAVLVFAFASVRMLIG